MNESDAVVWLREAKNPVMTFPIKKRINTEMFSDSRAELYTQNGSQNFMAKLKRVKW